VHDEQRYGEEFDTLDLRSRPRYVARDSRGPRTGPRSAEARARWLPVKEVDFGAGIHRCLGSHLAQREIRVEVVALRPLPLRCAP
jgi:hypothetical protein